MGKVAEGKGKGEKDCVMFFCEFRIGGTSSVILGSFSERSFMEMVKTRFLFSSAILSSMMGDKKAGQLPYAGTNDCSYCTHYRWAGTHGARQLCFNMESPYFDDSLPDGAGMDLTDDQRSGGCGNFEYNEQKILLPLSAETPKGGRPRRFDASHPAEDGIAGDMDPEPEMAAK
jgi:hypothetical protein